MAHEANSGQRPMVRPRTPIWLDQDPSDPEDDEVEIEGMATSNPAPPRSYFGRMTTVTQPYFVSIRNFLNNFSR